jgi:hypothetical protein
MQPNHPNRSCNTAAVLLIGLGLIGCSRQQTASVNPFFPPGRVPPPATQTQLPGTAQPYYPGDPLPATQGSASGTVVPISVSAANSSVVQASAVNTPAAGPTAASFPNEPGVAIPTDSQSLRFQPPKPPAEPAPFVPLPANSPQASASSEALPTSTVPVNMEVRLNAAPSPPAEPVETSSLRIRLPGESVEPQPVVASGN